MSESTLEEKLREEVEFWRSFIDDWNRVNKMPPLPRMLDALAYAEYKLEKYLAVRDKLVGDQVIDEYDDIRH